MQEDDTPNDAHPFSKLARAAAFAAERHQGQHRKGATRLPYITHPLALVDVLVSEAGGLVGDLAGESDYMATGNLLAGNPKIFSQLLQLVAPAADDVPAPHE